MYLKHLKVENLRSLRSVNIRPSRGVNLVFGSNGSGKTSLLEAIYLLGQGRSFRSRLSRDIISRQSDMLRVVAQLVNPKEEETTLGVEKTTSTQRYRHAGEDVRSASLLARLVPTLLITPESQRLMTDGARLRRRMLDWALFHVEPQYNVVLQKYRLALRQRNAELRTHADRLALVSWSKEMANNASRLHYYRQRYSDAVKGPLDSLVSELLGVDIDISYQPGWDTDFDLVDVLGRGECRDIKRGYTSDGPHRADVQFLVNGRAAHNVLSRGESKLFVAAVLLTQSRLVAEQGIEKPVILIDDLASELDSRNRYRLLEALRRCPSQVFITATEREALHLDTWPCRKLFHVEQGLCQEVI